MCIYFGDRGCSDFDHGRAAVLIHQTLVKGAFDVLVCSSINFYCCNFDGIVCMKAEWLAAADIMISFWSKKVSKVDMAQCF